DPAVLGDGLWAPLRLRHVSPVDPRGLSGRRAGQLAAAARPVGNLAAGPGVSSLSAGQLRVSRLVGPHHPESAVDAPGYRARSASGGIWRAVREYAPSVVGGGTRVVRLRRVLPRRLRGRRDWQRRG